MEQSPKQSPAEAEPVADLIERLGRREYFSDQMMTWAEESDRDLIDKYRAERKEAAALLSQLSQERDELRAKLAEARAAAFEEAAQIASDFADSEAIHAIAGMAISTGVKSPGWIKDALHSQGQEIATNISKAIHARAVKGAGQL